MTTQSTTSHEIKLPHTRGIPQDGDIRSETETNETPGADLKAWLENAAEDGKTRVAEWRGDFQGGIRANPIQSVLIAAAVGAVIGQVFGRRG